MENFLVSARKYRPDTFDTVVGQPVITSTLKSAILSGHLAHAYLFCGPRGVGKTTCARIFAKTINCANLGADAEPCNRCDSCKTFNDSRSFNIHELDAASNNSVDDIRNLIESVRIMPQAGKYSVYIIDEVHMLSQQAFNAFLKTLEEPPPHAVFILATTEKHKIIPTILSRCQIYDFNRIRVEDIAGTLKNIAAKEGVEAEEEALSVIALKADGAMRDALTIFDQLVSYSRHSITYKGVIENLNVLDFEYYFNLTECFLRQDTAKSLLILNEILLKGFDGLNFVSGLARHLRDILVSRDAVTLPLLETGESIRAKYQEQARRCEPAFLYRALELLNQCEIAYKSSRNQRLHVEIALIRLCSLLGEKKTPDGNPPGDLKMSGQIAAPEPAGKTQTVEPQEKHDPSGYDISTKETKQEVKEEKNAYPKKSHTVSIKDALQSLENGEKDLLQHEEPPPVNGIMPDAEPLPETPIVPEFMLKCWNAYAESIRGEKPRFSVALKSIEPVIRENYVIEISFSNQSQIDAFQKQLRPGLEQFLQRELQQPRIRVEATMSPADEHNKKLYTAEDKLAYLGEKNPLLNKFVQDLGLELE
ncbi:MAG: polymerase tau subunit [Bacteroidetes bacterium]|nr:polymerase tau subunit [Bacteroidota bacterium]